MLEPLWMRAPPNGRGRRVLQGLIQVANAALKLRMGRPRAAARLAAIAAGHFEAAGPGSVLGLSPCALAAIARRLPAEGPAWRFEPAEAAGNPIAPRA